MDGEMEGLSAHVHTQKAKNMSFNICMISDELVLLYVLSLAKLYTLFKLI